MQSVVAHNVHENIGRTQQGCPRKRFHDDLVAQLIKWHEEGDRLVVCLDANEDIYKKSLGKSLTKSDGLRMSEVVGDFTGKKIGPTFFCGSKPIDRIWATPNLRLLMPASCRRDLGWGIITYLSWTFRRRVWWALPHSTSSVLPPAA